MPPVSRPVIVLFNRQRDRAVSLPALRKWIRAALSQLHRDAEIGIHLVGTDEMSRLNWDFLRHEGSTDVITFDHGSTPERLHGECFISVADAVAQAESFGTTWTDEVIRYVIHGILHLRGYDDLEPPLRRTMKREENRWVRWVARRAYAVSTPEATERAPSRRRVASR